MRLGSGTSRQVLGLPRSGAAGRPGAIKSREGRRDTDPTSAGPAPYAGAEAQTLPLLLLRALGRDTSQGLWVGQGTPKCMGWACPPGPELPVAAPDLQPSSLLFIDRIWLLGQDLLP